MEIKVSEHKTPEFSPKQREEMYVNALRAEFGYQMKICGFCGGYHVKGYVCSCGWDISYSDELGPNGELVKVWVKQ